MEGYPHVATSLRYWAAPRPSAHGGASTVAEGLIIAYVAIVHLFWAIAIAASPAALNATPVAGINYFGPRPVLVAILALSALGSASALLLRSWWVMIPLIPQQILLTMSVSTAYTAVARSQYADGVLRPAWFIAADQAPTIILAFVHLVALYLFAGKVAATRAAQ